MHRSALPYAWLAWCLLLSVKCGQTCSAAFCSPWLLTAGTHFCRANSKAFVRHKRVQESNSLPILVNFKTLEYYDACKRLKLRSSTISRVDWILSHIFAWVSFKGLPSWTHEIKALPLFYGTLETCILALQHLRLRTDVRDLLVVRPVDAGRLVGGGCVLSRVLAKTTRRAEIPWKLSRNSWLCGSQFKGVSTWFLDTFLSVPLASFSETAWTPPNTSAMTVKGWRGTVASVYRVTWPSRSESLRTECDSCHLEPAQAESTTLGCLQTFRAAWLFTW